ncbi:MAG: hypothetical protein RIT81_35185 [Deltaproteobacteria bacterium]
MRASALVRLLGPIPLACALACAVGCSSDPAPATPDGTLGGPCYGNGSCNSGLLCSADVCVLERPRDGGTNVARDGGGRDGGGADRDGGVSDGGDRDGGGALAPDGCFSGGPTVRSVSRHAAAFDDDGVAHVALGGDALRYARHEGGAWSVEVVDPHGDVGSLALDADGQPVIAYFDRYRRHAPLAPEVQALKVARRSADGRWTVETIDPELPRTEDELTWPQIAVLPSGAIVVVASQDTQIHVARLDNGAWSTETLPITPATYVRSLEIAVDALGAPMLAFSDFANHYLIRNVDEAWREPQVVNTPSDSVGLSAFFADAAGRPSFVVYAMNGTGERLHVLRETGAGWDVQTCAGFNDGRLGYSPGLLADGTVAFGFFDYLGNPDGWAPAVMTVAATCDSDVADVGDPSRNEPDFVLEQFPMSRSGIAFAADDDRQLLVYLDLGSREVVASMRDANGTWSRETLTPNGLRGFAAALTLDADERPVVAGIELASRTLELSRFDGTQFVTEPVPMGPPEDDCEIEATFPGAVDVALHGTGDILVAYTRHCRTRGREIVLSRLAPFGWTQDVITAGSADTKLRIALDAEGRPAIVFGNQLAEFDGTQWVIDTIGSLGDRSARSSVAYDGLGRAVVVTMETRDVAVATRDAAGAWTIERIEAISFNDRMQTALAIDRDGIYHLAYSHTVRNEPDRVRYAKKEAGAWTFSTIEETTSSSVFGSPGGLDLALVGNEPRVIFQSHTTQTARIARPDGAGWLVEDVVTDGDTGWYPSIAVDTSSVTHAAFHHRGTADLCYATF